MAKEVVYIDDLDGGAADETVTFALDGRLWELDLNGANAAAFRRMLDPYISKARPATGSLNGLVLVLPDGTNREAAGLVAGNAFGNLALAAGAGTINPDGLRTDGRPPLQLHSTHVPVQPTDNAVPDTAAAKEPDEQPTSALPAQAPDPEVRAWAKHWSVPCPARGRVPGSIHTVYAAARSGDLAPWRKLMRELGVNAKKAQAAAEQSEAEAEAVANQPPAQPTQDDLDRKTARQVRTLSAPQLRYLRKMFNARNGRVRVTSRDTSCPALATRQLCTKVKETDTHTTYEITRVGRVWFEVRNIPTTDET